MSSSRLLLLSALAALSFAVSSSAKEIKVDAGGAGDFKTVQEAIDSVPANNTEEIHVLIQPGSYERQLIVPKNKGHLTLIGKGVKPDETILTFHLKASDPKPGGAGNVGTTGSASVTINATDFTAENVTFANSAGDKVGQAVALKSNGDRLIFRTCRFLGFQDTLYPSGKGRVYFKDCYITGNTDFIFGNAVAVFDRCTINSSSPGFDTAANTTPQQPYGFVFLDCTLTGSNGIQPGSVYLGRPWQWDRGSNASATYVRTKMGPHISPKGWHPWDAANTDPSKNTRYSEYASTDLDGKPLDISKRVAWSHQLTQDEADKITVESVLGGTDQWNPAAPATTQLAK